MSTPTVLDAKGRALEVGSRVERWFVSDLTRGMTGEVDAIKSDGIVWVMWDRRSRLCSFFESDRRLTLRRSYRCPNLLITDEEKGDGDDH